MKKLPELLKFNNNTEIKTVSAWDIRRKEIIDILTSQCYGSVIPAPKSVTIDEVHDIGIFGKNREVKGEIFDIVVHELPFTLRCTLFMPSVSLDDKVPVIVDGDDGWRIIDKDIVSEVISRGIALALFDRLDIVPDNNENVRRRGLYSLYPELHFGAVMAWAWGYSRVIDALFKRDDIDLDKIIVTGHSRGGKSALLAGALDKRVWLTAPNHSGLGGAGSFNYPDEGGEKVENILTHFPYWFSRELIAYVRKEGYIPFDSHFLKALIAPRLLLTTESVDDTWASPKGTQLTHDAAMEVFELYGKSKNASVFYRNGEHAHTVSDFKVLLDFIKTKAGED